MRRINVWYIQSVQITNLRDETFMRTVINFKKKYELRLRIF